MPRLLYAVGNVRASATVGVKPRVMEEIQEVHFTEGQDVTEGQLLITLTPDPLRLFCAKNAACWPNLKRS
ncbi:hypothetical protein AGMMS49925_05820 [Deltaproteobacteria bacterium]|nr:hypothetical protein AGMMS49925_05820 [Deltaproteobacteria bacterium]